jgi:hypothetical protein
LSKLDEPGATLRSVVDKRPMLSNIVRTSTVELPLLKVRALSMLVGVYVLHVTSPSGSVTEDNRQSGSAAPVGPT